MPDIEVQKPFGNDDGFPVFGDDINRAPEDLILYFSYNTLPRLLRFYISPWQMYVVLFIQAGTRASREFPIYGIYPDSNWIQISSPVAASHLELNYGD